MALVSTKLRLVAICALLLATTACDRRSQAGNPVDAKLVASVRAALSVGASAPAAETGSAEPAVAQEVTEWASLKGKFVVDAVPPAPAALRVDKDLEVCGKEKLVDEKIMVGSGGEIANLVLFVRNKNVPIHTEYESSAADKIMLDNKNCRFSPHVLFLRTTQTLELKNSDTVGHNTKISTVANPVNPILPAGATIEQKLTTEENLPAPVACSIHPWMTAFVVVRSNPYGAVTNDKGEFEIKNLPAGMELEFQLWQENRGYLKNASFSGGASDAKGRFKLKLAAGDTDLGVIKVPSASL